MSFLQAEWRKLAFINYVIDPELLADYLPPETELDLYNGKCIVSIVGLMFKNTKVLGLKIPYHVNFEELNLRFYVKRLQNNMYRKGVVFIKEIVPKGAISFIANTLYNENYETMQMEHKWEENDTSQIVEYKWLKNNLWQSIKIEASVDDYDIENHSETEFITERYWGYAKISDIQANEYQVTHPKWKVYRVNDYDININFEAVYGDSFKFLQESNPISVILAEGSEITVENKNTI